MPAAHPSRRAALTALVASPPPWRPRESPPPLRSFIRDVAGLPIVAATAVAFPGLVAAETIPHRPTAMLLHAYKEWLHNETRLLNVELFPRDWKEMEYCIFFTGIGGYHWNDYPNGPKPSTRAAVVLDAVGAKWRGLSDRDHLPEGPPSILCPGLAGTNRCGATSSRCSVTLSGGCAIYAEALSSSTASRQRRSCDLPSRSRQDGGPRHECARFHSA